MCDKLKKDSDPEPVSCFGNGEYRLSLQLRSKEEGKYLVSVQRYKNHNLWESDKTQEKSNARETAKLPMR